MKIILKILQISLIIFILLINILNFGNVYATNEIASGTCGNDITWTLDSDGTLIITGSGKMSDSTSAWIDYKDQVKNVIFNGDITSISDRAFEKHTNLETISLPDTVTTIGLRAFAECGNLKTVKFPKELTRIGMGAFYQCYSLQEADLGENIAYINEYAFGECTSLKNIKIEAIYTVIDDSEETFSNTATISGYKYSNAFYYARVYGRTFNELNSNETTTTTITNQSYLDVLPTSNLQTLGITSHNRTNWSGNKLNGYRTYFCDEKDENNETYQEIKAKVEELTANCTTQTEKAREICTWVYYNINYMDNYGANATIDRVYSIFNEKMGNCEAYTILTNYMLYLCGIPTATVSNVTHEWSAAFVDGKWIYLDSTHGVFNGATRKANVVSFSYDGLVYVINDPLDGGKVTGIAKTPSEIENITTFTIPTNSYMKEIYETSFDRDVELKAEIGTVGAKFIENNRLYCYTEENQIIGSNTQRNILGDVNGDGEITLVDYGNILAHVKGTKLLTGQNLKAADVNQDGEVTLVDYGKVLAYVKRNIVF